MKDHSTNLTLKKSNQNIELFEFTPPILSFENHQVDSNNKIRSTKSRIKKLFKRSRLNNKNISRSRFLRRVKHNHKTT